MVVPTIQVIGVVASIVFFQTLEWLALLLARVDVTCSGVLGGASMSACLFSSPKGITPMIEQHFLWLHP